MWFPPTKGTTPGELRVIGCGVIVLCFVLGAVGLYLCWRATPSPDNQALISQVRFASIGLLGVGSAIAAIWYAVRRWLS